MPELQIQQISPDDLTSNPQNPRQHPDEQIEAIAASIREFGFLCPILTDKDGRIISGEGRWLAAKKIGRARVPAITAGRLTKAQMAAFIVADNKLYEQGGWDDEILRQVLADLDAVDFDLALTGLPEDELAALLEQPDFEPVGPEDQGRLDEKRPVTCPECGHEFHPAR